MLVEPGVSRRWKLRRSGQFQNLERARTRWLIVVPLSLFLIFLLLFSVFNSVKQGWLVLTGVPLGAVGGVSALLMRGMPFSISAAIGFIALFGVAVLNGVVMVSYINTLRREGRPLASAIRDGALVRLRPVMTTALVASLGFIPMRSRPAPALKCSGRWPRWSSGDSCRARS
jgi:heavy metal efflux system protein